MKYLSPAAASRYLEEKFGLSLSPKSLANRRWLGLGPRYVRVARRWPRYRPQDLDNFAELPEPDKEWRPQEASPAAADERASSPGRQGGLLKEAHYALPLA